MRLLLISNLFPPKILGGYELAAHDLAQALAERGHTVRVLTSAGTGALAVSPDESETDASRAGVDVRRELRLTAYGPAMELTREEELKLHFEHMISQPVNSHLVLETLREFQPDAVQVFNVIGIGGAALLDVLRHSGVPFSLNLGDAIPVEVLRELPRAVHDVYAAPGVAAEAFFADIPLVAVSSKLATEISRFGVELSGDRLIVPRGIRVPAGLTRRGSGAAGETALPASAAEGTAGVPAAAQRTFRFVFASVLFAHKGVDLVLDAAAALLGEATEASKASAASAASQASAGSPASGAFTVDMFGAGDDAFYRRRAEELGLSGVVRFHGNVDRAVLYDSLATADAFLFPTAEREALGQVGLQAAALGCTPIVTAQAGVSEWLSDEAHCLKIDRTVESLAEAMRRVVAGEVDVDTLGRRAQRLMNENYSFETYVDAVFEFMTRPRTAAAASAHLDVEGDSDIDSESDIDDKDKKARRVLSAWLAETRGVSDDLVVPRRSSEWPD
ncbi:glycosyltransferase family 4 protein [Subtercola endophyticus]|uniref:glycosyltransferase family 4 protein n=1 Tax=Subtercola endophyticus TaxID=2895559 RepID=UPI001E3F0B0B|nr:glycosyltransferase family 4 protein [Subtercola endophyticus]UFS57455.1 glycosyltransferase family 4 protein [Subtercola endophyticus]